MKLTGNATRQYTPRSKARLQRRPQACTLPDDLLDTIASKGVLVRSVTLHVGIGTFRPVKVPDIKDHRMDEEFFEMDASLISEIEQTKNSGHRVIAVGTTTTRTIEGYLSNTATVFSVPTATHQGLD